jgi:hypothetical protein
VGFAVRLFFSRRQPPLATPWKGGGYFYITNKYFMKTIYLSIFLLLFPLLPINASEIRGRISTSPSKTEPSAPESRPGGEVNKEEIKEDKKNEEKSSVGGGILFLNSRSDQDKIKAEKSENEAEIIALGASAYADGTLLRGPDKRIYVIKNGYRMHIPGLNELKKYAGQKIHDVSESELADHRLKKYFYGQLIREAGQVKIYEITEKGLKHILSLEELRRHYFGREIVNISPEEMAIYQNT